MPVSNSTADSPARPASIYPAPYLVSDGLQNLDGTCETAKSLVGRIPNTDRSLLVGLTCRRWSCRPCSTAKIRRLAVLCKLAGPNRLLTLTIDPALYQSPRHAFEATAAYVPELIRYLRTRFGAVEYLRVTELTKRGFPHYHLLIRSGFLPHAVVRNKWNEYTQATIVDLKAVGNQFGAYTYLTKYLTKMHHLEWTERHVSYSKNFFPAEAVKKPDGPGLAATQLHDGHPHMWLAEHCLGLTVTQLSALTWDLGTYDGPAANDRPDGF